MKVRNAAPLAARRGDPRGQVLVLFALMLVVLLLVSALAVDYGGWLVTRRNYQNVTDAASLAGAQHLTRSLSAPCPAGGSKAFCAKQAAWQSVRTALNLTALNPAAQAGAASNLAYQENGYSIWVASPPSDANVSCAAGNPLCIHSGTVYPGHVSGPGTIFVRVEKDAQVFLSRIAGTTRQVAAWATAGRFPANFAVIGMCSPTSVTTNCLAGDANIKIDGTNSSLIVNSGDLGTNRWTRTGGTGSAVALGPDSNAYMQLYDSCWNATGNQCNLFAYTGGVVTTTPRAAIPLGSPIQDPAYVAPTINATTAPNQCRGTGTVQLASVDVLERQTDPNPPAEVANLPIALARSVKPLPPQTIAAAAVKVNGQVVYGGTGVAGLRIDLIQGGSSLKNTTTDGAGNWSINGVANGTYTVRVTDSTDLYNQVDAGPYTWGVDTVVPTITVVKNALVQGTVRNATTNAAINNATVTISALGTSYTATTDASGAYSRRIPVYGGTVQYSIAVTATGYTAGSGSVDAPTGPLEVTYTRDFALVPTPASLNGTITDIATGLPVPGVTVTLGSGGSATTNASGAYNIASATVGTTTITLDPTTMVGYAYSTPASGSSITISAGSNTRNFTLWPKGCDDRTGGSAKPGSWSCDWPSTHCPAPTNKDAANVSCTFTQANAIRPGTYDDITIGNGMCAWFDPKGGQTGLASGQSGGIYHIKGDVSIGSDAYLFGDGITLVFDQGANFDVQNGGGFVLNYGTAYNAGTCDLSTPKNYNDGVTPCFRTVSPNDGEDYAYAAWTTKSHLLWSSATFPTYSDDTVAKGSELGITFFMYGSGLGTNSRFKIATASMGYLFNGVLYAPNDDVELGGGKNGQSAAGQIVGWTIEYHGGTRILQNWYGDPVDGRPFLIEPILGE